jgi:hypothetical protein
MSGLFLIASLAGTATFLVALFKPVAFSYKLGNERVRTPAGSSMIDRSYFGLVLWFFALAIMYVVTALALLSETASIIAILAASGLAILAVFVVLLAMIRIFGFPETRYLFSQTTSNHTYTLPRYIHRSTEDGVLIQA